MYQKKIKRIGLLTNIPSPYRLPLFQLLDKQDDIQLEVAFNATSEHNRMWQVPEQFDFNAKVLPGRTLSVWSNDLFTFHINHGLDAWIRQGEFDAMIVGGWLSLAHIEAIIRCYRYKIPIILWSGSTIGEPSLIRQLTVPLVRQLIRLCDAYIVYGTAAKQYLEDLGADSRLISIAPNTIDTVTWANKNDANEAKISQVKNHPRGHIEFLYVGQLIERKGVDTLLDAFAILQKKHPQASLSIVGTGPLEGYLKHKSNLLDLNLVRFIGHIPYQELPNFYANSDIIVLPSLSEVWGLTLNEAMACARPVIASDATGASIDLICNGQTGWITQAGNIQNLAEILISCSKLSDTERKLIGQAAQQHVLSNFTIQNSVDGFLKAIYTAMSSNKYL